MRFFSPFLFLAVFNIALMADRFEFKAFGATQGEAKANALSELAGFLSVKVESEFNSITQSSGGKNASQQLHLSSNLPLGGARVNVVRMGNDYEATASLDPAFSLKFYESTLDSLTSQINSLSSKLSSQKGEAKERSLEQLYPLVVDHAKYHAVYKLLGGNEIAKPSISEAQVVSQIQALSDEVDTLNMAIKHLTKALKVDGIYITPITPDSSHIPTPFSGVVQDMMITAIHGVTNQNEAKELLSGRYRADAHGMQITLFLTDAVSGKTLDTRSVRLLPQAYKTYAYQSVDSEYDRAIASGVAVDENFHATLTTNKGSKDLLFKAGSEVKIVAKLTKPGYFYIVAHAKNPKEEINYLLPIYDNASGDDRFIRYVPANEVNREISLGEFTVEPPYGLESLQLIASTQRFEKLPETKLKDDYALLQDGTIAASVTHTRGLKPKTNSKTLTAEATVDYLTVPEEGK